MKICIRFSQVNDVKPFNRAFEQGSYLAATDGARADYKAALPRKFQKNWIVMHKASDRVITENIFVTYELSSIARPRFFVHRWGNGGFRVPFVRCSAAWREDDPGIQRRRHGDRYSEYGWRLPFVPILLLIRHIGKKRPSPCGPCIFH